ncbi:T9SS type A sorting domain-containing protein [Hyphobacterium sp. CCMP332]|nr:T9SS type A sorting domain-containing protein [Hyphobacterium sp. CCMP332]
MKYHIILLFVITICYSNSNAVNFKSVSSGDWLNVNTWSQNGVSPASRTPQGGDTIFIESSIKVTITSNLNFTAQAPLYVEIYGILEFLGGGSKLRTSAGSGVKVVPGGSIIPSGSGGGSSKTIEIGGTTVWKASNGPITTSIDYGTTPAAPLPVSWVKVEVQNYEGSNIIQWITADEEFTSYFNIERSNDLISWVSIAQVDPNESGNYNYLDNSFKTGFNYYRVKHIETNGTENISTIVNVFNDKNQITSISLYPNPCVSNINIKGLENTKVKVKIISLKGELFSPNSFQSIDGLTLDVRNLQNGNYVLMISGTGIQESIPFIKN